MRQCRGKRKDKPDEWAKGGHVKIEDQHFIIIPEATYEWQEDAYRINGMVEVIPDTTGQATGLKDKNGVDLNWWEGDVFYLFVDCPPFQVVFERGCFYFQSVSSSHTIPCYEVATWGDLPIKDGNIHDNPELLHD